MDPGHYQPHPVVTVRTPSTVGLRPPRLSPTGVMAVEHLMTLGASQSPTRSMVVSMATKKVTITLDKDQVERIRALVEAGTASSVSGFVQHAVGVALDDVAGWGAMLADALTDTGGELSRQERRWADEVLGIKGRPKSPAA